MGSKSTPALSVTCAGLLVESWSSLSSLMLKEENQNLMKERQLKAKRKNMSQALKRHLMKKNLSYRRRLNCKRKRIY